MLGKIRSNAQSPVFKVFLTFIALSFVLWGVGEFATGSSNTTAITVGDTAISVYDLNRAYQSEVRAVEQQLGGEPLDDYLKKSLRIGQRAMGALVQEKLLTNSADSLGLRVSNAQLLDTLHNTKAFQVDGQFSRDAYRNVLRTQGMTTEGYEQLMRGYMTRITLNRLFVMGTLQDPAIVDKFARYSNETATLTTLKITEKSIKTPEAPSLEAQKKFYETSTERWKTPEYRSFALLTLSPEGVAKGIEVSEEDLRATYDEDPTVYNIPEKREARHILLKDEATATATLERLKKGEDFSKLAKELSEDSFTTEKGGNLGSLAYTDMPAEFSGPLFSLKEGELSAPVKSSFGYHIIEVTGITPAQKRSFDTVKEEIRKNLQAERAEDVYFNLMTEVEDRLAGGETLPAIAGALGLELRQVPLISRGAQAHQGEAPSLGLGRDTILDTAFSLEPGRISERLELGGNQSGWLVVGETLPPALKPFEEVQVEIVRELKEADKQRLLEQKAAEVMTALKGGEPAKNLAKKHDLELAEVSGVRRDRTNSPAWLPAAQVSKLFEEQPGGVLEKSFVDEGARVVAVVKERKIPEITEELREQEMGALAAGFANDLRTAYLALLERETDISLNRRLVAQALPGEAINYRDVVIEAAQPGEPE